MHPVLFHLGSQPVYAYGLMLSLSILIGWQLTLRLARQANSSGADEGLSANPALSEDSVSTACLLTALAGLVGGRLLYVAVNAELLREGGARWYELTSGGTMAFGGIGFGVVAALIYARVTKLPFLAFADVATPALALGTAFTRVGCYLYGCDFGTRLSESAPAFLKSLGTFPRWGEAIHKDGLYGSPAVFHHMDRYALARTAPESFPVHPTQLYEAAFAIGLMVLALVLLKRRHFRGQVIAVIGMLYAVGRFGFEYIRDEPDRGEMFGFSVAQVGSLILLAACALVYAHHTNRGRS